MSPSTDNIVIIFSDNNEPSDYRVFKSKEYADGWTYGFTHGARGEYYAVTLDALLSDGRVSKDAARLCKVFRFLADALAPVSTGDR